MNNALWNHRQFPASRFCRAVLLIGCGFVLSACFRSPPVERITYDPDGKLALVELTGQTWPEFFQIVQRESGFQIQVSRMPPGTVAMRLEMLESWERLLEIIAETKDLTVTRNSEKSFTLNPK